MSNRLSISSPRLILRAFAPADADDLHAYLSEPGIYKFEPGELIDLAQARNMAQELAASPDFWAVELQETHRVIGQIYFKHIEPQRLMTWELGFILNPQYHRQGYMSEAVAALVRHGFANEAIHRVVAHCNPDNSASWKLLEKIGFRREGLLRQNIFFRHDASGEPLWTDTYVYAMLASEAAFLAADSSLPRKGSNVRLEVSEE
jgi:[ribosomal protein S5]-alanine N-acetyltransferase